MDRMRPRDRLDAASDPSPAALIAARPQLRMHGHDGLLFDRIPLNAIATMIGTPTWVYSADLMRARFSALATALTSAEVPARIQYAVKANDHIAVLRVFAGAGAGADVVSGGELLRAQKAGIAPANIVFSGVGKTMDELRLALAADIAQINVESAEELERLSIAACTVNRTARVALRVNPDIDAGTHAKIGTGRATDKFGIPYPDVAALYAHAAGLPGLRPVGLAVHIGSQISRIVPYRDAYARMAALVRDLRAVGQRVETLDCGGGLGIGYRNEPMPDAAALADAIAQAFGDLKLRLMVEPGRWLVGPAGVLLSTVVLVKRVGRQRFVVLDAAMNDLVRPALYDAWHGIVPVSAADLARLPEPADVVGPVCESGDTFALHRALPPLAPGARVAILDAGAYGAVMSSTYNARPLAAAALIDGGRWATIRARQPLEALWAEECVPDWLA